MKKTIYIMVLCLFIGVANAQLKLSWEMDTADDYNLGEDIGGAVGRTYVTNAVTGELAAGMTADSTSYFDAEQGALRMSGSTYNSEIYGQEDPNLIFTSETQYTFSLWAKGDLSTVSGNGYSFYVWFDDGSKFKCDLGFQETQAACFTCPGGAWSNNASNIWNPDPNYADRYVNPESWNMYTFTWDSINDYIATYVNGELRGQWDGDGNDIPAITPGSLVEKYGFGDGYNYHAPGGWYRNFRIWDEALDANAVADLVGDFFEKAQSPTPYNFGDLTAEGNSIDVTFSWKAGKFSASHDLYIGTNFNDVNTADTSSADYIGNFLNASYDATLVTGNTYYWRVDEVNDIDLWKGDVWTFDVIKMPDPVLFWQMDSEDDYNLGQDIGGASGRLYVDNKATGTLTAGMTATGGLVFDEDEGAIYMDGIHPCRVYGLNGNVMGDDPNLMFTSYTQYTFSLFAKGDLSAVTGNGYSFYLFWDDGSKFKCDLSFQPTAAACFSCPGGGWQNNAYHIWDPDPAYADRYVDPETWNMYTFVWDTDNQFIATYVNGIKRASRASGTPITTGAKVTDFGFGDGYGWSGPGGWYKDFRIYDIALDDEQIDFILGDFLLYPKGPSPKDNSIDIELDGTVLTWNAGIETAYQDVYFGENYIAVKNADTSSPEYQGQIALENTYDPGALELMKDYYWRVDQLDENGELIVKGPIWHFASIESIIVEDFEAYDDDGNDITAVWQDTIGWGDIQISRADDPNISPVSSMKLRYHIPYDPYYAVAARSFSPAQDWTVKGVKVLTIHYYGTAANMELPLFVTIGDGTTDANVIITDVNTLVEDWQEINVSLPEIEALGVDLTNISYIEIGFGDGTNLGMSSSQWNVTYIDDIALYPPKCVVSESTLSADLTGDCVVNYEDLDALAYNWLLGGYTVSAASVSDDGLVLHYDFDGNTNDSVAGNNGTLQSFGSSASFESGYNGQCIHFNATASDSGSNMSVPPAAFADVNEEVTFSFWLKNDTAAPAWYQNTFGGTDNAGGRSHLFMHYSPAYMSNMVSVFHAGSGGDAGWAQWDAVSFTQPGSFDYTAWNHIALVKNCFNGEMWMYTNGQLSAYARGEINKMYGCDEFKLGSLYGDAACYQGSFDDFRVYNRALSHAEILALADQSSATVTIDELDGQDTDLNDDQAVDFKDYSILASEWLTEDLWP